MRKIKKLVKRSKGYDFTFIDLFAGIGGFHIAAKKNKGECIFSSEIDKQACKTYKINHGKNPYNDITKQEAEDIPNFDLLCGGFPCQSFSQAGKRLGFEDVRGTLVYDIIRILKVKRPKAFILENVPGLLSHDNGRTFYIIRKLLGNTFNKKKEFFNNPDSLGYNLFYTVLNSANFGLAQNRKRIFIVGFRPDINKWKDFQFPKGHDSSKVIGDILEDNISPDYFVDSNNIKKIMKEVDTYGRGSARVNLLDADLKSGPVLTSASGKGYTFNQNYIIDNKYFLTKDQVEKLIKTDKEQNKNIKFSGKNKKSSVLLASYAKSTNPAFGQTFVIVPSENDKYFLSKKEVERLFKKLDTYSKPESTFAANFRVVGKNNKSRTVTAVYNKGHCYLDYYSNKDDVIDFVADTFKGKKQAKKLSEIKKDFLNKKIRIFTPRECARLQGFPESFKIHKNDAQAYKQLGNAVSPPVVTAIIKEIKKVIINKNFK